VSDTVRLIDHLALVWPDVVQGARASVRQLHEWTGGFRFSTSGASVSSPPPVVDLGDDDGDGRRVVSGDRARRDLVRIFELVDELVVLLGDAGDSVPGERLPSPAHRLESRLAFVQWQINKLGSQRPSGSWLKHLERAVRSVNELDRIVKNSAPARDQGGVQAGGCTAHASAGEFAEVDDRYRAHGLCRRCGEFRSMRGRVPSRKLIRWAEKHGWRSALAPAQLRKFGFDVSEPRR